MTKLKFNYEQYLRILVALKRAFFPLSRDLALGNKKVRIDRCLSELRSILPESKGDEMTYMVAHLCYMQQRYSGGMEKHFRPSTLWRKCHFSDYMEDTTVTHFNRAREVIRAEATSDISEKFIIPLPSMPGDFTKEKTLLADFKKGTGMAVLETTANLTIARDYMGYDGLPQGSDLVAVLKDICSETEPKYITFNSLIAKPDRVLQAFSKVESRVVPAERKVADPDGFWGTYRLFESKYGCVSKAIINEHLVGNKVARFLSDASILGAPIAP